MNDVGKPCAGEPHARFDRGLLAKQRLLHRFVRPFGLISAAALTSKTLDALGVQPDALYAELQPELRDVLSVGRPIEAAYRPPGSLHQSRAVVEEVASDNWGIGGSQLTTADVRTLAAGLPAAV